MQPNSTLIGLGNILMRDEGAGIHAIEYLRQNFTPPDELEIVDGGTSGLDLLPFIENRENVFFVDTVNFRKAPGYIGVLTDDQIPALFGVKDSLHHMGLMDVLAAAQLLEKTPKYLCLIGIQPEVIETGLTLTKTIEQRLKPLVGEITSQLSSRGIQLQVCDPRSVESLIR